LHTQNHPSTAEPATTTFAALGVPAALVRELTRQGLTAPFPIQSATLPDTLDGRDVLGRGRTGSGKTLAFSIPVVARLAESGTRRQSKRPRALVLVPTRELARQVHGTMQPLARAAGMRTALVYGGVGQGPQATALRNGVDILIACPGRLEDLIGQRLCDLSAVEVTVLDEADHMADLGFLPPVRRLLDQTPRGGQRMLFSATLDNGVDTLVRRYLDAPLEHSVDAAAAAPPDMAHHVLNVSREDKNAVIRELASGTGRSLLFTRTKHSAKRLAKQLTDAGIPTVDLHGNLSQNARERNLAAFASGRVRVLTATDIAARGIHVDNVELVVHVDPPAEHKAYLHRSGRTARAGTSGSVVTVVTPEQKRDVAQLVRQAKIRPTTVTVSAGAPELRALVGETAPRVSPSPGSATAGRPTGQASGRPGQDRSARPGPRRPRRRTGRGRGGAVPASRAAR
jgi:superfamily II DNA/RNA helicase